MRNYLLGIILFLFIFGCTRAIKDTESYLKKPYIEIQFSLNKNAYPRLMGFLKTCYPQIAIWTKETDSTFEKTIFVTEKGAHKDWTFAESRPSATPVWSGVRNREQQLDIDGISGATPSGETHTVIWPIPKRLVDKKIDIFIEANVSFDYNEHYTDDGKTESNTGVNGQPSLIWKSKIELNEQDSVHTPILVGHGHVNGKDDQIHDNLEKVTTAKQLFNYIKIKYMAGPDLAGN
jgi:hypothetical protein